MRPLAAFSLALFLFAAPADSADRYLVATRAAARTTPLRMLRDSGDFRVHDVRSFESVNAFAADLTPSEVAQLKASPHVRFVTPVVERHASDLGATLKTTNGSAYAVTQTIPYGVVMVHAPELWKLTRGAGLNVAVLDTGIDPNHPDLAANYAGGFNTFDSTSNALDDNGHGTHVTGIIAALDNNIGVVGVAPEVHVWAVKVLDHLGMGVDENIIAGLDWVIRKKAEIGGDWVVNMSLGAYGPSPVEHEAIDRALADHILIAAAAGNRGFPVVQYPAGYAGVVAVGAVDSNETLAPFSNYGPLVSIVGPGVRVLSSVPRGSVSAAGVTLADGALLNATTIEGSSRGEVKGQYVICGLGNPQDFPVDVQGKIALIRRGDITFNEKVRNAQTAGAAAVVIFNKDDSDYTGWTLIRPGCDPATGCDDKTHAWPVALAISAADGERLVDNPVHMMDVGAWLDDYKLLSGTSQATPHVAGTLALVWSLDPTASAERVKGAVLSTATDLGAPGPDEKYGNGLVDALAAGKRLAPWQFDRPAPDKPSRDTLRPNP